MKEETKKRYVLSLILSGEQLELVKKIQAKTGLSKVAVVRQGIFVLAKEHGLQ